MGITELYVYLLPNYWVINGKTCVALPNCESYWAIMEEVSHECPTLRKKLRKKLRKNVAKKCCVKNEKTVDKTFYIAYGIDIQYYTIYNIDK